MQGILSNGYNLKKLSRLYWVRGITSLMLIGLLLFLFLNQRVHSYSTQKQISPPPIEWTLKLNTNITLIPSAFLLQSFFDPSLDKKQSLIAHPLGMLPQFLEFALAPKLHTSLTVKWNELFPALNPLPEYFVMYSAKIFPPLNTQNHFSLSFYVIKNGYSQPIAIPGPLGPALLTTDEDES